MRHRDTLALFAAAAGIDGPFLPESVTLETLHRAWPQTIPFENIEVLLNRPLSIDVADIADKLLKRRRGGYCFEHNLLFRKVLEEVGFSVTPHLARVVWGLDAPKATPQTHVLLIVSVENKRYIADVGFGGVSMMAPLLLEEGKQHGFVLERTDNGQWLLSLESAGSKKLMYLFDERPCEPVDILVASHFVATHEDSLFRHNLMMAGIVNGEQLNLFNLHLTQYGRDKKEKQAQTFEEFAAFVSQFFSRADALSGEDIQAIYKKISV